MREGDEVTVVEEEGVLRIVRVPQAETSGQRLVRHMRGRGGADQTRGMSTDELMELLRGD